MGNKARKSKPISRRKFAPVKVHKVRPIDHKNTALLRRFISDRGRIRARRATGVTTQEQRLIAKAVKDAREMVLPSYSSSAH